MKKGTKISKRFWKDGEDRVLRAKFHGTMVPQIARILGRSVHSVRGRVTKLGLRLSAEESHKFRSLAGKIGAAHPNAIAQRIQKGNVPANEGLRRPGWFRGRMRETQFKKGQRSRNWVPVGGLRDVGGYLYVKISNSPEPPDRKGGSSPNWVKLHHKVWEDAGNPPVNCRTHALAFRDRNRKNCKLSNLELITRRELRYRNSIHNLPPDLKRAVQQRGDLVRRINRMTRKVSESD